MNKDIASIIKAKILLAPVHPIVDKVAGLVQTVEFAEETMSGASKVARIPVSIDTNIDGAVNWKDRDLVPNSANRSIIYFEDNGITTGVSNAYGKHQTSKLTMICWMNTKRMSGSTTPASDFATAILNKIEKLPFNSGKYLNIKISHESILPQDARIFSRYTYDEKEKQYLMSPYEFFAVNLVIKYIASSNCSIPTMAVVNPNC